VAKKILVVDDEPDTRTYLETLYQENGYETATASDGEVAMPVTLEFKPDLISLDIIMPNETGQKFYRKLCKSDELKNIPVVFCSSPRKEPIHSRYWRRIEREKRGSYHTPSQYNPDECCEGDA
jgi:DNA-binding response OmpR family regulator